MSSSPESRARIAFVAFIAVLAAAAAAWYLVARDRHAFYEIRSHDSVSGLIVGAPVEFHGVEVGKVDEVQLADPRSVRVVIAVKKDVPVTTATVATITGRGLAARGFTGYMFVSLEEAKAEGRPLVPGPGGHPVIASAPSQVVSLDTTFNQLNENVQAAVGVLRATLDAPTIASLKQSAAHLDEVTRTLAANSARMQSIMVNAERATTRLPPLVDASARTLRTVQTELLPQAGGTLVQMNGTIAQTQDTVQTLRTQLLPEAQQTVTRLDELAGALTETAERVRRNPAILVRGTKVQPGPGEAR